MDHKLPAGQISRNLFALSLVAGVFQFGCGSDSGSSGSGEVQRHVQFDASNILHGFIPTDGQFEGKVTYGTESRPIDLTTVVWMKSKTPYQTGLMKFSLPGDVTLWKFELTKLPDGVVCTYSTDVIDFAAETADKADEFVSSGSRVVAASCVYNVEAVAATLPGDLVLLVNGTEVTIPASSAGAAAFNIPVTSFTSSDVTTWLPSGGTERPPFVTDNWGKLEKRSVVEDMTQFKNVKSRDFSYSIVVKDKQSPCAIENGSATMATQHHAEVAVQGSSQLVTPALLNWHSTARKQLTINCNVVKLGSLMANASTVSFDNGSNKEKTIVITNSGSGDATLGSMTDVGLGLAAPFSKGAASTCATGAKLAPAATCNIVVSFAPTAAGSFSDSLSVSYNDGDADKSVAVALTGSAVDVTITPTTHDFGTVAVNGSAVLKEFTVTNVSSGPISLGAFTTSAELGLAAPFFYQNGDTSFCYGNKTIASGASCTIKVGAFSAAAGTFDDALEIPYSKNGDDGKVSASVKVVFGP